MKKNILLIIHNFLPISGPRTIRWNMFIKKLISQGYKIDIITTNPSKYYPSYDESLLKEIPKDVKIIRTYPGPIYNFSYLYLPPDNKFKTSFKISTRNLLKCIFIKFVEPFLIPDKCIFWLPFAINKLRKFNKNKYDLVISSGYPFTGHIVGYFAKRKFRAPWIADYGPKNHRLRYYIDKLIEGYLLKHVNQVVVTTDATAKGFEKHFTFLKPQKIKIISQGANSQNFTKINPERNNGTFRIVYTGTFYKSIREPYIFFEAVKLLQNFAIEVIIAGHVDPECIQWAMRNCLQKNIIFLGYQNHERVVALQKGADVLLNFGWVNGHQIPGKIYEYFNAKRPILSIKYDNHDISAKIIKEFNCGLVAHNNKEEIMNVIKFLYNLKQTKQIENYFNHYPQNNYSWDSLAKKMENVIENVIYNK